MYVAVSGRAVLLWQYVAAELLSCGSRLDAVLCHANTGRVLHSKHPSIS
jgi:hypothetical protein